MKMVLADRQTSSAMDSMPHTVPSAGFTPPCDYTNFAENFDLSLLPGGDDPLSPSSIEFYPLSDDNDKCDDLNNQPKIFTTFYPNSPSDSQSLTDTEFQPDFEKLFSSEENKNYLSAQSPIHLEVPSLHHQPNSLGSLSPSSGLLSPNDQFGTYREHSFYPSSPEYSLYTASPSSSIYSKSPCEEYLQSGYIKQEILIASTSPLPSHHLSPFGIKEENYMANFSLSPVSPSATSSSYSNNVSSSPEHNNNNNNNILISTTSQQQKIIKQESTVDFSEILGNLQSTETLRGILNQPIQINNNDVHVHQTTETPKDHQLLRQFLRDTSFQKKYNIQPNIDFAFVNNNNNNNTSDIKMEEPEVISSDDLIMGEEISRESIEPVLNMAIEQMRKDVDDTCILLGISPDPSKWSHSDVISWIRWTSRQFNCTEPEEDSWTMSGVDLLALAEKDFANRVPQGGMILYAQLEIWKAAYSEEKMKNWNPDNAASNASTISGDISEDEDDDQTHSASDSKKATTTSSRTGSHIHLWQFLKELLQNSQNHGSCIRWLDRTKGIFKIEDSVKVARLWGKRKNRPAMNYDKLSRSIRQYYKKGIMKKTERSQRLVYQFCHPYNL